jgi:hypothetical protein
VLEGGIEMTFRKRRRFFRRLGLTLAFAALMASPAAGMHALEDSAAPVPVKAVAPHDGDSGWDDALLATGSAALLVGVVSGVQLRLRSRDRRRLGRRASPLRARRSTQQVLRRARVLDDGFRQPPRWADVEHARRRPRLPLNYHEIKIGFPSWS